MATRGMNELRGRKMFNCEIYEEGNKVAGVQGNRVTFYSVCFPSEVGRHSFANGLLSAVYSLMSFPFRVFRSLLPKAL